MFSHHSPNTIRPLLLTDALLCTVTGAVFSAAATPLGALMAIPPALIFWAGILLFPVAAVMVAVATRTPTPRAVLGGILTGNGLWVLGSVVLLLGGWIAPNTLGTGFVVFQALAVAAITLLEYRAARPLWSVAVG